jgi:hypothetical protein
LANPAVSDLEIQSDDEIFNLKTISIQMRITRMRLPMGKACYTHARAILGGAFLPSLGRKAETSIWATTTW